MKKINKNQKILLVIVGGIIAFEIVKKYNKKKNTAPKLDEDYVILSNEQIRMLNPKECIEKGYVMVDPSIGTPTKMFCGTNKELLKARKDLREYQDATSFDGAMVNGLYLKKKK